MAASTGKHKLQQASRESHTALKRKRDDLIFILPTRIQKKRLQLMKKSASKKGLSLAETFSLKVSHVATECDSGDQVLRALKCDSEVWCEDIMVVKLDWVTECLRKGHVVPVQESQRISMEKEKQDDMEEESNKGKDLDIPDWACQRAHPVEHFNEKYTKPLEILEKNALFNNEEVRALAFRRASASLKSLPRAIKYLSEVNQVPSIGGHSKRVIKDVLNMGFSQEADDIEHNPEFQKIKLFSGIFGVGPTTARKWIIQGLNTIEDVRNNPDIVGRDDERLALGLAFYEDLNLPVLRSEAEALAELIIAEARKVLPGTTVVMTGGFRRGKPQGHDIDFLLSHPEEGREQGLLGRLLFRLQTLGLLVNGRQESSTFTEEALKSDKGQPLKTSLDHFEKWLGVMKIKKEHRVAASPLKNDEPRGNQNEAQIHAMTVASNREDAESFSGTLDDSKHPKPPLKTQTSYNSYYSVAKSERDWHARRVDLIVVPASQYFWALVGWTGSRQFNRSLRLYAMKQNNQKLTSHGLWDFTKGKALAATSEKAVFDALGLPYHEPHLRNA